MVTIVHCYPHFRDGEAETQKQPGQDHQLMSGWTQISLLTACSTIRLHIDLKPGQLDLVQTLPRGQWEAWDKSLPT